jgi:hypothetical protein
VDCIIQPAIHISNESPAAVNNENCSYSSLKLLEGLGNVVVGGSASRGKNRKPVIHLKTGSEKSIINTYQTMF